MSSSKVTETFLDLLDKSALLTPDQLKAAGNLCAQNSQSGAKDIAEKLIAQGMLTTYQAEELLDGNARSFFVDKYKKQHVLGIGGMGHLYIAEDVETGQQVALKMLSRENEANPGLLARFKIEARVGMKLNHPNIVKTLRLDHVDGIYGDVYYMIMEFVEAISLEELVALQGPKPWQQACDIIGQAAAGLYHAHLHGLTHRDVKPANLLVSTAGHVKVLDFGLSLFDKEGDEFSLAMIFGQDCLGTADYIAPEQTLDSYKVDPRADIYSLGCTFYATLTGRVPFPNTTTSQKLELQRTKQPQSIREINPDVPAEIEAIVTKMMAKKRENRFQSARDVCVALAPFAKRLPAEFDYQRILRIRAREARKRLAARNQSGSQYGSRSSTRSGFSTSKSSPANVETKFREDTQPS